MAYLIKFPSVVHSYHRFPKLSLPRHSHFRNTMGGGITPNKDTRTVVVLGAAYGGQPSGIYSQGTQF